MLHAERLDSMFVVLDKYIVQSSYYMNLKENKIHKIKKELQGTSKVSFEQLHHYAALFEEYKSYKYDSAYVYAIKTLEIANKLNDPGKIIEAKIRLVFCFLSSGLFKEAFDIVKDSDIDDLSAPVKLDYYKIMARLYYDMADYNGVEPFKSAYVEKGNKYSEQAIALIPVNTVEYWSVVGLMKMKQKDYNGSMDAFKEVLKNSVDNHEDAIAASSLAYINSLTNQHDEALINLVKAAISDIKSGTKETVAMRNLATLLYQSHGDINQANKYIKLAMDDANFYNARHRKIEISSILPIIEKERFDSIERQRNLLIWLFIIVTVLLILFLGATLIIRKQLKKLKIARKTIQEQNEKVLLTNSELYEANKIKDKYIGHFFYVNYQYIDKLEHMYRLINRKVATKQYDEFPKLFKEADILMERKNMYTSFDQTFLKLFPDFINEYKLLFPLDELPHMGIENGSLTVEMRIFALIRLGVIESEKISKFLNYSIHTINTYKTKVKNKSIVQNELFEQKIMEIKSVK
jgi:tetratricopeptide (TPR) repeat protein